MSSEGLNAAFPAPPSAPAPNSAPAPAPTSHTNTSNDDVSNDPHTMQMNAMGFIDWCSRAYTSTAAAFGDLMDNTNDATACQAKKGSSRWIVLKGGTKNSAANCICLTNGCDGGADGPLPIAKCVR